MLLFLGLLHPYQWRRERATARVTPCCPWIWVLPLVLLSWAAAAGAARYDYPFVNAYEATVVGTPKLYMPALPEAIPVADDILEVFPEREIPPVFWYSKGLRFSLVSQDGPAPLIFVVAGTGGDYRTGKVKLLQKAFSSWYSWPPCS